MKCVYCLLFVLCFCVFPLPAQDICEGAGTWLPVGEGIGELYPHVDLNAEINGELYLMGLSERRNQMIVISWNGKVWAEVAGLPRFGNGPFMAVTAMTGYDNELYIGNLYDKTDGIDSAGVLKWNGTEWEQVVTLQKGNRITAMIEYQGKLVVAGRFDEIGGVQANNIAAWNGVEWETVGSGFDLAAGQGIKTLFVHDNTLYAGGLFRPAGSTTATSVAMWDGTQWSAFGNSDQWTVAKFAVYKDTLYASGYNSLSGRIIKWNGAEWMGIQLQQDQLPRYTDLIVYNDRLYTSFWSQGLLYISRYDGSTWEKVKGTHGNGQFVSAGGILYLYGSPLGSCGIFLHGVARFCDESCGTISGFVFHDNDGDCVKDNNERPAGNRIVRAEPGGFHATVNKEDGTYSILVPPGSYTVSVSPRNYWQQSCPTSGTYSVEITEPAQSIPGNNFAFVAAQDVEALEVSIAAGRARPGREVMYSIRYENVGTLPFTGTMRMLYDALLLYQKSTTEANRHIGSELEWDIDNLPLGATGTIEVRFELPPDASLIGTTICSHVQARPGQHGDPLNEADSYDEECTEVTGSYDPNEIVVSPRGTMPEGFISPTDTVLQYVIHFQNTGNDTAFKVVIFDKMPQELDLSTLRAGASSHRYELDITENNELRWVFRDIMLPDSTASEPNSHGYVKYEIQVKKNLALGTVIKNSADIYFDYNAPVRTNEVVNTIKDASTTGIGTAAPDARDGVYPNPAGDRVAIVSRSLIPGEIAVYNSLGEAVLVVPHAGGERAELTVHSLAPGVYYVSYPTAGGALGRALTIVR